MAEDQGWGLSSVAEAPNEDWKHWVEKQLGRTDHNEWRWVELMEKFCGQSGPTIFKLESRLQSEFKIEVDEHTDDRDLLPAVRAVTIGPYHRNCKHPLKFNDDYKWKVIRYMVRERSFNPISFLEEMEKKEEIARKCYDENFPELQSKDFRVMLMLDGAFIVFALDAFGNRDLRSEYLMDYMGLHIEVWRSMKQIKLDFLMLNNQIPLFAIEQLYAAIGGFPRNFGEVVLSCFDDLHPKRNLNRRIKNYSGGYIEFHHLLHLFHWSRVPEGKYRMDLDLWFPEDKYGEDVRLQLYKKNDLPLYIPSATELLKSSTVFRKKTLDCLLDITFEDGLTEISAEMNIPTLHLYDYSKHVFSNLIAFETNYTGNGRCVTAYSMCMSRILQNEDDARLLRRRGILANTNYKDADAVKFFENLISRQVEGQVMPDDLLQLCTRVTEHHKRRISNCYGELKLRYFPNPWITFSLVGAFVLFLLSLLQTIYTVLGYYQTIRTTK
uniref:Uncharacterized protein n=1 Tax=Ananas comosus var. bracteatus TaxID=296719 RepID=A0A6V7PKY3_ANACO|nr:unnamed protein product [Ananas comosus var. bracteatus]